MKLNNAQIEAIINSIENKKADNIKEQKALMSNQSEVRQEAAVILNHIQAIPRNLRTSIGHSENIDDVVTCMVDQKFKHDNNMSWQDRNKLRDKIILCSINASDMDALKKELEVEF